VPRYGKGYAHPSDWHRPVQIRREQKLAEDVANPIISHNVANTCWQPHVKGHVQHQNSIYNNWRFENVWLDK
jgi:hypothetical protein